MSRQLVCAWRLETSVDQLMLARPDLLGLDYAAEAIEDTPMPHVEQGSWKEDRWNIKLKLEVT